MPTSFPRGTANTLLIAEAAEAVPWTKPADMEVADDRPLPRLGGLWPDGFHAVMGNVSTRWVNARTVNERTLRIVIDPNNPTILPENWSD